MTSFRHTRQYGGYDFAGSVVSVFNSDKPAGSTAHRTFTTGDEVYGKPSTEGKECTWAEYAIIHVDEMALKPTGLDWADSATVLCNGSHECINSMASFILKAGIPELDLTASSRAGEGPRAPKKTLLVKVLITGSSGAVGIYLVQLGSLVGLHIVAASTSKAHNEEFLRSLGADDVVEYGDQEGKQREYDIIIDTVGGTALESCWPLVKDQGSLITIDSLSFNFLEKHRKLHLCCGKQDVKALFFIVEHSGQQLQR
jgi:NADPH:quinone reductase-like Zn-dependent oxidoreductase